MRNMRNLVAAAAALAFFALTCLQAPLAAAFVEGSFQRTLPVTGPVNLEVNTGSGSIDIRTGTSGQVQVIGRIKAAEWFGGSSAQARVMRLQANPPILQSGNDLRIGHIDDPELRRNISISYELVVPPNTRLQSHTGSGNQTVSGLQGRVEVGTGSGSLTISDNGDTVRADTGSGNIEIDRARGSVRAKTGSGSIQASGIAGGFEGDTGSGNVKLEQTAPGAVRVSTGSGSIELRGVHGSLDAQTGSGSLLAEGDPTGMWKLRTGSGGVRLRMVSEASFDLDARTSSGSISMNQPITVQGTTGRKEVHGKVNGGGVSVNVETGSGSIEIQ
jgi:Putative adhesin